MAKKYSIAKIDRMRWAVKHKYIFGCRPSEAHGDMTSQAYSEDKVTTCVEEILRTYMIAGVEPGELE